MSLGPSIRAAGRQASRTFAPEERVRISSRRFFSTTLRREDTYGFIGLGAMGAFPKLLVTETMGTL